ncbi:MAG: SpoIIE family protein phosphatase, partial [Spirochaetota bacterium]
MTIRRKLTIGVLTVFLASFALVSLGTILIARESLTQAVVEQMLLVADGYAEDLETRVETYERVARDLSRDILVARTRRSALKAKAELYTDVERFHQTDLDGNVIAQYPENSVFGVYNYEHEPFWRQLMEQREPSMSGLRRVYGYPSITFSAPVFDPERDDSLVSFVHAVVSTDSLFHSVSRVVVGETGYAFVVDDRGRFLSHPTATGTRSVSELADDRRLEEIEMRMRESRRGAGFYRDAGSEYLIAFSPVEKAQWTLGVQVAARQLTGVVDRVILLLGLVLALAACVVSIATYALVGNTLRPVYALVKSIADVGTDNQGRKIEIAAEDEIGTLANAYNDMIERLEQSFHTIQEYSRTLEQTVADRTEQLRDANRALREDQRDIERQLTMARRVQQNLLPGKERYPKTDLLKFGSRYLSMDDVGGDFYDIIEVDKGVYGLLIADVSGHGMAAALITALVKVSFQTNMGPGAHTDRVLSTVNGDMLEYIEDLVYFVSAFFAIYDTETEVLRYTNAGHHPALLVRAEDGAIEQLDTEGLFIGSFRDVTYVEQQTGIHPHDRLIMFTDGIVEARDSFDQFYEYERFYGSIRRHIQLDPEAFVTAVLDDVKAFMGDEELSDDQAIFCVDFNPGEQSQEATRSSQGNTEHG